MTYEVTIKDTATGEERIYVGSGDWDDAEDYLWNEGNYACDCNRGLFFQRVKDPDFSGHLECGDSRYEIKTPC